MRQMDPVRFALIRAQMFERVPPQAEPPADPDSDVREPRPLRPSGLTGAAAVDEPDEAIVTERLMTGDWRPQ